ncbi:MAG: FecR domain-containing protein [Candidatus Pristimantibacillus lignocellulolyticus]|uniref:FecR domain-containing protein n=1 Tax=Candidatus Pristimantibacillus lignocellulolyticus TaxID=2994561 RepID=A0A9J6ZFL5_9BACL|nr:MAG: FecR domain-containing protein [Candidatus Pristimantibacillus lignocellulolyticus]
MKRWSLVTFVAIFLVVSIFSHVGSAEAATSRVAIISKIEGTVEVQKSGGKKTLKGFKGMSLNQGDVVTTGKKSSVVLKFSNGTSEDDTFVLESSTTVTFSKLSNKSGTTTKVSMLKGKVWVDVKSIKNKDDEFVLETPTAIMGVRGTNFFVGVDPNTGLPSIAVLSGNVNVTGSGNNTNQFNVYPASAITVGDQNQDQTTPIIPIDNQVLAQMLNSTSAEVMKAILESAQKIISENQNLMNQFTNSAFPTEINQLPLSQNQYTDNVYNLLLALAQEASKLNKIDGNTLLELQKQIKEQQLANNELHQNTGNVDWNFEQAQLTEQQRLEKLRAEQAKKDALTNSFNANEQKAKADKLKQDRLDALEKKYLDSLSQAEREKYEREKQNRLDEEKQGNGGSNSGNTTPPLSWSTITKPFDLQLQSGNSSTAVNYIKNGEDNEENITNLLIEEPIVVNSDDSQLIFSSTDPSIELLEVTRDGEPIYELDDDNDGNGDGVFTTYLYPQHAEMGFTIKVKHSSLGEREFNLNAATTVSIPPLTWSDIEKPFDLKFKTGGKQKSLNYYKGEGGIDEDFTYKLIEGSIPVNGDDVYLEFTSVDSDITIVEVNQNGLTIENPNAGRFITQLEQQRAEMIFTITVEHSTLGTKVFKLGVDTVVQPFNIYEMWGALDGNDLLRQTAPYRISEGFSYYDYVITIDNLNFTEQYLNFMGFNRKNDADQMWLRVKEGDEWRPLEMNPNDSVEYIYNLSPGTNSIQFELEYTRDGITETYLINIPSILWNN